MSCVVEQHQDIQAINEWLHSDVGYGKINDLLIQRGHNPVPTSTLGRHREKCLGLEPKKIVRGEMASRQIPIPPPTLPLPSDDELVSEAKRILFWRMKNEPKKVTTNVLASILAASMREKKPEGKNEFEEILEQLGRDSEESPASTGESLEETDNDGTTGSDA